MDEFKMPVRRLWYRTHRGTWLHVRSLNPIGMKGIFSDFNDEYFHVNIIDWTVEPRTEDPNVLPADQRP